jgi:O-antigen ligase
LGSGVFTLFVVGVAILALAPAVLVLGYRILESVRREDPHLVLACLWCAGVTPGLITVIDPGYVSSPGGPSTAAATTVHQAALLCYVGLIMAALVGRCARQTAQPVRPVVMVSVIYSLVLVTSGLLVGSSVLQSLLLAGSVLTVTSGEVELAKLTTHLRYSLRAATIGSLVLLMTSYEDVVFTGNRRTLLGLDQLAGVTPHPNVLAPLAALALAVELAPATRRISVVGTGAAGVVLVLAQSRSGWVAAAFVVLVAAARGWRRIIRAVTAALAGIGMISAIVFAIASYPVDLLSTADELNSRGYIWLFAWRLFVSSPIFGAGPGAFSEDREVTVGVGHFVEIAGQAHNQVLQTMAQAGLCGLLVLIVLMVTWERAAASANERGCWLPTAAVGVLFVSFLSEGTLRNFGTHQTFLVLAVVVLCVARHDERRSWQMLVRPESTL